jgi:hypothetical protein
VTAVRRVIEAPVRILANLQQAVWCERVHAVLME